MTISESEWDQVMSVNLKSMWMMCASALPELRRQGGAIVNVSSIAAVGATPIAAYSASKAGVNVLTKCLAVENAPFEVRVNAVMPGLIDTPIGVDGEAERTGRTREAVARARGARVPLGRMGTAWDVALASCFLMSSAARYITGVVPPVDGGITAGLGYVDAPGTHETKGAPGS